MREIVTLVSPDGHEYATDNPAEITRLKSSGYAPKEPDSKPVTKPASK